MKHITTTITSIILCCTTLAVTATAQNNLIKSADEAIEIALKNNQSILAKNWEVASTQALKKTAGELPKLNLNAQLGQYNSINFDQGIQLSQTLPFPTVFNTKKELINAELAGKELQRELSLTELKSQVRIYYYQIQYLQQNEKILSGLDSLYDDFTKVAQLRYQVGDTKKVDVSTAEAKKGEIDLLLKQNSVYLSNAYQALGALLSTSGTIKIAEPPTFQPLLLSLIIDSAVVANHPAIRLLHQEARVIEQKKKLEKTQLLPDFTIGYANQSLMGYQFVNGQDQYFGAAKRFSYASVGVTVPLSFNATRARVKSLDYAKQAVEANAAQQQRELAAQLENAWQQYQQDLQRFQYYQQRALLNASDIIAAAQLGYRTGDIGYVEYLYSLQAAADIRLNYLSSIQQVNRSVISIYSLINQ